MTNIEGKLGLETLLLMDGEIFQISLMGLSILCHYMIDIINELLVMIMLMV